MVVIILYVDLQLPMQSAHITHGEVYSIQLYVITFVSDLRQQVGGFPGTPVSSTNKTDHLDIISLKVALKTIIQTLLWKYIVLGTA